MRGLSISNLYSDVTFGKQDAADLNCWRLGAKQNSLRFTWTHLRKYLSTLNKTRVNNIPNICLFSHGPVQIFKTPPVQTSSRTISKHVPINRAYCFIGKRLARLHLSNNALRNADDSVFKSWCCATCQKTLSNENGTAESVEVVSADSNDRLLIVAVGIFVCSLAGAGSAAAWEVASDNVYW